MSQSEDLELITERRKVYGDPEETFCRIAEVWSGILGVHVNPVDVPLCMAGMKLVRTQVCPDYSDNSDDIIGYMDIFRLLVGDDMIEARSVQEYLEKKKYPLLAAITEAQLWERCMICKQIGSVNFQCGHPDAHIPCDWNGEPHNGEPEDY